MSEANKIQIDGDHYKIGGEEHWDRIWRLYGRGYFIGCITKYVERYHIKNGLRDLAKAQHFLTKLIELETSGLPSGTHYQERREALPHKYPPKDGFISTDTQFGRVWRCRTCGATPVDTDTHRCNPADPGRGYVNQD